MALNIPKILRKGIKTADKLTKSAQAEITYRAWESETNFGVITYGTAKKYRVILDLKNFEMKDPAGRELLVVAYIAFIYPVTPNGATGRVEPIDERDEITLPDGSKPKIVVVSGFVDSGTGNPYFHEVWLGSRLSSPANT